jgi:uncharacterized protein YdeI (YjbR/CyaY-like superfamily)
MDKDSRVDDYIATAPAFAQPILVHLRQLFHESVPGLSETLKWSRPFFTLDGKILGGMSAFKAHAALMLHGEGRVEDGMGSFGKIGSLADLPADAALIPRIRAAADELRNGTKKAVKPRPAPRAEIPVPDDFTAALVGATRAIFDAMPPGARREYLEWVTEAKREETRAKRIAQAAEWIAEGKKRNWKYESC